MPFIDVLVDNSKENKSYYCLPESQEDFNFLRLRLFFDWETLTLTVLVWFPDAASAFFSQLLLSISIEGSAKTSFGYNNNLFET